MRHRIHAIVTTLLSVAACVIPLAAQAWPARLDYVTDGDTITVVDLDTGAKVHVRLEGIDAPEVSHGRNRPGQPYGKRAEAYVANELAGARIAVHPNGTRSYDRIVAWVSANGQDIALPLVRAGLAWDYPHYDHAHRYTAAEQSAEEQHRGLWAALHPISPWDWRHYHWNN